jgi:hypothetical protein
MSIEALVTFTIFLFLSLLVMAIRWLNEKLKGEISLRDLFPSDDSRAQREDGVTETTRTSSSKQKQTRQKSRPTPLPERRAGSRLRLRNKSDLRQGIIIMTVLGPCRALQHPDDRSLSS